MYEKNCKYIFCNAGGIFFILLLVGAGFYLTVTFDGLTTSYSTAPANAISSDTSGISAEEESITEFTLTDSQKKALSSFGINPDSVPSSISAQQEACFVTELGKERVEEIKTGGTPSAMDFFKAKNCI